MVKTCLYASDLGARLFCPFITLHERAALVVHEKNAFQPLLKIIHGKTIKPSLSAIMSVALLI